MTTDPRDALALLRLTLTEALRPVDPDQGWTHWTTEEQAEYLAASIFASALVVLSPAQAAEQDRLSEQLAREVAATCRNTARRERRRLLDEPVTGEPERYRLTDADIGGEVRDGHPEDVYP